MIIISQNRIRKYVFPEYADFTRITDTRAVVTTPTVEKDVTGETVPVVENVLTILRGSGTMDEILSETELSETAAKELLSYLEEERIIFPDEDQFQSDVLDWLASDPARSREQLQRQTVGIITSGPISYPNSVLEQLEQYVTVEHYTTREDIGDHLNLLISVASNERPDWQEYLLADAMANDYQFLPGRICGTTLRIGPLTLPTSTPCYHCFYTRWLASSDVPTEVRRALADRTMPHESVTAPLLAYQHLESLLLRETLYALLEGKTAVSKGSYIEYDIESCELHRSDVLKLPGCDSCGMN